MRARYVKPFAERYSFGAGGKTGDFAYSSQYMVYALKGSQVEFSAWNTTSFVSSLGAVALMPEAHNIIIVDEFIGTGKSLRKKPLSGSKKKN